MADDRPGARTANDFLSRCVSGDEAAAFWEEFRNDSGQAAPSRSRSDATVGRKRGTVDDIRRATEKANRFTASLEESETFWSDFEKVTDVPASNDTDSSGGGALGHPSADESRGELLRNGGHHNQPAECNNKPRAPHPGRSGGLSGGLYHAGNIPMPFESASSDSAQAESAHRETYDPMEIDEGVQFDEQPSRAEASGSVSSSAATSSGGVADGSEPYKQEYGGSAHVWTTQRDIRINLDGPHVMKCSVCGAGITISYDDMVRQFTQMKLIPCPSCEGKSLNKFVVRENKDKKGLFKLKHIPSKEGETTLVDNLQQGVGIGMKVLVHNYIVEKYPHFMSERLDDKAYDAVYDEVTIYFLGLMRAEKVGVDTLSQNTFQVKETKDSERWHYRVRIPDPDKETHVTLNGTLPTRTNAILGSLIASEVLKLSSSLVGHNSKRKAPYSHLSTEKLTELAMFVVEAIYATMGMGWKEGAALGCIKCDALQQGLMYEEYKTQPYMHGSGEKLVHMKDCPRSGLVERCDDDGNFICQARCSEIPDLQARVDAIYRTMTETTLERLMRSAEVMRSSKKTKKRKSG